MGHRHDAIADDIMTGLANIAQRDVCVIHTAFFAHTPHDNIFHEKHKNWKRQEPAARTTFGIDLYTKF